MAEIKFRNVDFSYPLSKRKVLNNISFDIKEAEFIVLCGKSGCGKSTLLRHIKKNLTPYGNVSGKILYGDVEICNMDERTGVTDIGFVHQNPDNQIVTDKVWHELAFGLESLGKNPAEIRKRVAEMASYFGIQTWFRKNVSQLSGGQKQLLNLASIMVMQPKVLVLDEPTSQLDPIAASEFLNTIHKINRELGVTIILSEHRLEEVFPMADKVMVMDDGKLIAYDEPGKIGEFLSGRIDGKRYPLFYGLPAVVRVFENTDGRGPSPLTIRDGRKWLSDRMKNKGSFRMERRVQNLNDGEQIISVKDLWFKYDKESGDVLRGLNLSVKKGELYCLLGGNGVGKSTALKAICGILKPQRGSITVDGIKVSKENMKELFNERLAMLPQNPQALFTEITVEEELLEILHRKKISDSEKVRCVDDMLQLMEIKDLSKSNPYDLSGGEQQRLALGKILLLRPKILLLDEATKGLDPFFKRTLAKILKRLTSDGVTIFMVSHDIEFCAEYADRCGMFFDGSIVSTGTPTEFFSGNSFYTTSANMLCREWCPEAITCREVEEWIELSV